MRRVVLVLMAVVLIMLCSCELSMKAPEVGKVHILVYGNDYAYDPDHRLNATINDAVQVGRALSHLSEKSKLTYDATYIYGLDHSLDETIDTPHTIIGDITYDSLVSELENLALRAEPGDMTFLFFSGHGSSIYKGKVVDYGTDTASGSYFWTRDSSNLSKNSPIEIPVIMGLIEAIPGAKVVFSDFCYSGAFVRADYVSVTGSEYKSMEATELFKCRTLINESSSTFYLSAARYNEESHESGNHGHFTKALLQALGWNEYSGSLYVGGAWKDNRITFSEVAIYATKNDKDGQTPMYSGGSNDLVLFSF